MHSPWVPHTLLAGSFLGFLLCFLPFLSPHRTWRRAWQRAGRLRDNSPAPRPGADSLLPKSGRKNFSWLAPSKPPAEKPQLELPFAQGSAPKRLSSPAAWAGRLGSL